jgi:hypothetical protein
MVPVLSGFPKPQQDKTSSGNIRRKPFRMNTSKSVSKQTTLSIFGMNTYEKTRGRGVLPEPDCAKPNTRS